MSTQQHESRIKIYGVPLSVHTRKVILAARVKGISHEVVPVIPVIPDHPPPNFRELSPTGLIPAIDDDGYTLADSTAIVLYLERKSPEQPLLPAQPRDYGRALFLDAWAGAELFRRIVHPLFHNQVVGPRIRKQPGDQAAIEKALNDALPQAFGYLEKLSPEAFLVGTGLSLADLAVVSNLIMFHYLGYRIDPNRYPRLAAYFLRQRTALTWVAALQDERPFAENMGLDRGFLS